MKNKPRKRWSAAFLTLLTMGLGHIYCGKVNRGIIFFAIHYVLLLLSYFLLLVNPSLTSLLIIASLLLILFLICLIDVLIIARKRSVIYKLQKFNKWYVYIAVILLFFLIPRPLTRAFIKENVAKTFNIPAGSMIPTLLIGDMVLAKTDPVSKSKIKKGELIIFNYPNNPDRIFIKRVIAMEGDTLAIKNKKVLVNDIELNEPYIQYSDPNIIKHKTIPRDNLDFVRIPNGSVFVLGDNRDESYDSRFWGFVKKSHIIGKAAYLFWSWDNENDQVRWDRIGKVLN